MSKKKTVFNAYDLLNSPEMSAYLDQVEAEESERQKRRDAEMAARQRQSGSKPGHSVSDDELSADALKRDNIRQTTDDISGRANDVWQALKSGGAQLIQGAGWLANEAGAHDSGQFLRDIGQIGEDQALANMTPAGREAQKNGVFKEDLSGVNDDWGRGMAQGIAGSAVPSIVGAVLGAPVARGIGAAGDALLGRAAVSEGALGSVLDAAIKYTPAPVMRLAGALPGAVGAGAGEAAVTGATNGAQAYQEVMDAPIKSLRKSPAFQSLSKELGSEDAARKAIADRMSIQTAKDTALSTGLIGAAMGGGAVGSLLNKFAVKQGAKEVGRLGAKAAAKEVLKDGAKEFTEEFAQSGPEHYLQNAAKRDYLDPTIDPSTGMLRASLEGGVVGMGQGMGMSGGAHAVNRLLARNEPQPSQPANTPQQQPNTQPSSTPEPVAGYDPIAPNQQALLQRLGVEPDPAADEAAASVASIFGAGDPTAGLVASVMRGEALQPIHDMAAVRANTVLPVGSNEGGLYEPQWLPDAAQGESANGMRMPRRGFDSQEQLLANAGMDAQDMQRRADIASQVDAAWAQQQNPVQKARELESLAQESAVQVAIDRAEQSNQINQALANAAGEGMAVPNAMQLALQQAESRRNSAQNLPDSVMTKALTTELKPNSDAGSVDVQRKTTELPTELPTELKSNSVDAQRTHGDDKSREIATNHASVESKAPNTSDQAPNISSEPALTMQQNERGQWIIKGDMAQHAQTIRDALPGTKLVVSQKSGQALVQMPADKNTGKQGKAIRKALDHLLLSGEQLAARDQQRADASERAKAANRQAQQIDPERDDIVNAVAKLGGIDTEQALSEWWRGQRETIGHYNAEVPGNLRRQGVFAFKRGGMPIDDMVRHLEGEGYLPHNATPNDLLAALENRSKHPAGYEADARREFDARQQEEQANAPGEFQQAYHDGSFADDFMLAALEEDGYFDLNRQQREAIEAAAQVADDQFWSDAYDGKLAVTPTEEQLDEIFGPERVAGQSQADETAGADDAGGTGAGARSVQEDGNAQSQENEFSLAGYTESDLRREEQAAEQQQREVERQRAAADKARQDEETRKEIRRRSEAAADTFTLGGNAEDNLTGQGGLFDAPTESSGAQNTADNNGNWLNELFGNDGTEPAQQSVQRDTGRPKEVDFSLLVPKIRAFVSERIAEADDWAGRKYKHNEKQIHLDGDGPAKHESISISSANESRRRSTIDNLTHQANAAKSLIGRIERGENISHELAQAIEASDADIETIGKPRFGKTRNDQAEAYISNMLLGDRGYRYGKGTLAHLLLAEYENFASTLAASSAQNIGHSPENTAETPQNAASSDVRMTSNPDSKTPLVDAHEMLMASVREGDATPHEFKSSFDVLVANAEAVKAELGTKTKVELLRQGGPWVQMRYANEKKAAVVDAVYRQMIGEYSLGESVTYGMGKGAYEAAVRKMVEATDSDKLESYKQDREAAIAEAKARNEARAAAIENPKTLADFREAINAKIRTGMTRKEAFLSMTPEQRIQYDTLEAENTREARDARKRALKTQVRTAGQTTAGEVIATKHTKYGHDLFVVQLAERVSHEDYKTLNDSAKRMGGSYSSFRGNGAVPGFQFRTREAAEAFGKLVAGDTSAAAAVANGRRDAFEDDRSQSAVERLRAMAEKLDSQADAVEGQSRKTNTARRARFASAALSEAAADRAKAKTMLNIAQAIEDGRAKFLDEVRTKSQVDMIASIVATAKDNELRAKYQNYSEQEKRKGEPPTAETADFAEFPSYTAFRSDLAMLGRQMLEVDGTKKIGQKLMSVADDVTDAYLEFAKSHVNDVSQFGTKGGGLAVFSSRDAAERAIKRSGLTGTAIVLPVKRGENRVILSPSEAIQRGIWSGDGDKRITLTGEFGAEMVEAIGRRGNKGNKLAVPWQFQSAYDRRKALARIGIETPSEYRSALREFIALKEQAVANRVRDMELQMVGRKADGLDFFPTSADVADQMMDAAELAPNMAVLEPSAGMGHLADRIRAAGAEPDVIEISPERRALLEEKGYHVSGVDDFMEMKPRQFFTYGDVFSAPDGKEGIMRGSGGMGSQRVRLQDESGKEIGIYDRDELTGVRHNGTDSGYDRIIMNPPFSGRRDAEHVRHAYDLLKPGGRIVAIMGEGVFFGSDKKAQEFRDWLESVGGTSEKLPEGSFMDASLPVTTSVNARMVVIDKPESGGEQGIALHSKANDYPNTQGMSAKDLQAIIAKALPAHLRERVKVAQSRSNTARQSARSEDNDLIEAEYDPATGQLTLYADAIPTPERALFVLSHEMTHYGLDAKYGFGLSSILLEARNNPMIAKLAAAIAVDRKMTVNSVRQDIADALGVPVARVANSAAVHRLQVETANEALAELNAAIERNDFAYLQDRYGVAVPKMMRNDLRGRLARLTASVKAWLAKLTGKQATDYSDKQVWDLLAGVRETVRGGGKLSAGYSNGAAQHSMAASSKTINVDGVTRPTTNSNGQPIAQTEEGLRNFWRWFGDSKVVDKDGKPLVVYHGGNVNDVFDKKFNGTGGGREGGFFFTPDIRQARDYAGTGDVKHVYLSLQNPAMTDVQLEIDEAQAALDSGYDGYWVIDDDLVDESEIVVFDPTQIKSATGNRGTFSSSDPNILRSTAPKQPASAGFVLPEETTTQQAQREVQDNMNRWKQVLENVREQGGQVDEQNDVYSAEERFHGRAATRIEDFARDEVEPLMERLADSGHTLQEVEQYLLAQHAEEANARIREIDDSRDTAFGMEDGEAQSILAKFAAMPDAAEFKRLANDFRRISEGTLSLYVKAGIVSPEAAHAMRQAYQFYVPVKGGDEDQAARQGMGKGLSVNGKQKRRMGHDMRDEHVLENMLRDRQRAIVLAEKNNVGTYLLDLIERNPDPKLWTVNVLPKQKVLRDQVSYVVELNGQMLDAFNSLEAARVFIQAEAARTGSKPGAFAVSKSSDPYVTMMAKPTLQDHEVQVYVQGRAVRIQLHDPILAGQYRRMGTEQMGRIIEAGKSLNRWLSKVYTGYNPEFFIKNVVRDLFAGSINLTADQGGKVAAKALSHWPKAGAAMFRFALTGKAPAGEYGKALQRYRAAGGSTGAAYMGDLERQADTLQTLYENYSGAMAAMQEGKPVKAAKIATRKLLGGLAHWFEVWNQAGENAFRLATFMAMEDAGKTVAQSASMAKNVTVNFNRKGELTPQLGALYLFFNPNVQGTARMYQSLFGKDAKHKAQAWAMVGAMAGARLALAAMGRALMGDDEWEEIPDGVKDRNLIIALGNGRKLTIPLPYGYSFFASMANRLDAVMHGESAEKASVRLASAVFENFSPVGNPVGDDPKLENTLLLLPTALKIPALPAANLSGFGGQMRPEYDRSQPDNEKMYRGTRGSMYDKASQAISGGAESIGIGSRYENDWADISPETIKYLVKTLTGGTGGFLADSASLLNVLASGSTPDVSEVPFVRSGMRESTVKDARARFHELGNEAKEHVAAWKRAVDAGDDKAATEYEQDGELMAMGEMLEGYRKQATALRDLMAMEMQREDLTLAEKRMKQKAYENQEAEVYRDFIRQFKH